MESDPDQSNELRPLAIDRIHELLGDDTLPATTDEVVSDFGDVEVDYPGGGSETLEAVLNSSGKERYETMDDLQLAVQNGVQRDAVGRPRYSDRDPPNVADDRDLRQSF